MKQFDLIYNYLNKLNYQKYFYTVSFLSFIPRLSSPSSNNCRLLISHTIDGFGIPLTGQTILIFCPSVAFIFLEYLDSSRVGATKIIKIFIKFLLT